MKRTLTIALLVCALALLLCVAAYAADAPTTAGIYELKTETPAGLTVKVEPCTSTKAVVAKTTASIDSKDQDFYAEAEQLKVTVTGAAGWILPSSLWISISNTRAPLTVGFRMPRVNASSMTVSEASW